MKKALIYNIYLHTAGGGERATLDLCLAMERLGFEITLISFPTFNRSIESLCSVFGIQPVTQWNLHLVESEAEVTQYCMDEQFDVFINFTFCSSLPNPAKRGIYCVMFPQQISEEEKKRLSTYQLVLCISEFSDIYLKKLWGASFPSRTLHPPISDSHMSGTSVGFEFKEKTILTVGRFNVEGHCKCQLEAIQAFNKLKLHGIIGRDWSYTLVGNLNAGEENFQYFKRCIAEAGPGVTVQQDVSFSELQRLYSRATMLWQFTGVDLKKGLIPQHCEHLGLVAMDSMCYGTIPVVYQRSGVGYIINHCETGFIFDAVSELTHIMKLMEASFAGPTHRHLFNQTREASYRFSFEQYVQNLNSFMVENFQ